MTKRVSMDRTSKGYRWLCQSYADDIRLPLWLRMASLANGHQEDGQAHFQPGYIADLMATWDYKTGDSTRLSRLAVTRAIASAVEYNFLAEGSSSTCLVLPSTHPEPFARPVR